MSPADNEPSFAVKQRTVQRKLGRCLIRLQQVELLVKALWIDSEHECAFGQIEEALAAQAKRKEVVADKTLGTVLKCCRRRKSVEIWRHKTAAEFGVDRLTHKGPGGPLVIYGRWGQKGGSFSGGSLRVMRSSRYRSSKAIS